MSDLSEQQIVMLITIWWCQTLAVIKQRSRGFHLERFNLKKLNVAEGKEQYHVEVSDRFAALEDVDTEVDVNMLIVLGKALERL
jgi:hypothetical protein